MGRWADKNPNFDCRNMASEVTHPQNPYLPTLPGLYFPFCTFFYPHWPSVSCPRYFTFSVFSVKTILLKYSWHYSPSHLSGINLHIILSETFPKYHILISCPLSFILYDSKHGFVASIAILAIGNYFLSLFS